MISKIATIIIGIGCLWYGSNILMEGWSYLYGHPISRGTGVIVLIFGAFLFLFGCFRKARNNQDEEKFLICLSCRKTFREKDVPDLQCLDCGSDLEKLDGFYERHPEIQIE
jgi:hypothetical protein